MGKTSAPALNRSTFRTSRRYRCARDELLAHFSHHSRLRVAVLELGGDP